MDLIDPDIRGQYPLPGCVDGFDSVLNCASGRARRGPGVEGNLGERLARPISLNKKCNQSIRCVMARRNPRQDRSARPSAILAERAWDDDQELCPFRPDGHVGDDAVVCGVFF